MPRKVRTQGGGRRQVRQIKPKAPTVPASTDQKKQQQRYIASGGMLQGHDPELVMRIGYGAVGFAVVCLLIMTEMILGPVAPSGGIAVRITAALAWLVPIFIVGSFLAPGVRLAWSDRKREARLVQGQLQGASSVSTQIGLGMLMVKTRGGVEQYLCAPEKLAKVPGNQVNVSISVTPGLRHVRSVSIMGQRMMARVEPPIPPVIRRMHLLAIVVPGILALAVILGDDIVSFIPLFPSLPIVHVLLAIGGAAVLGGGAYLGSTLFQRRVMAEFQGLMPS